ncbi:DUF998 domain-containing protein [Phenylobacterium aquaticum]|uniref:DUF998 domain-containing protein n=1 Tax=Phenylobacterium aquaticum TaxID=1763816 RepID=UPI0026ECA0DD|nr:DUF998 domain-containing protein [Phenylobacterium aquaticum]
MDRLLLKFGIAAPILYFATIIVCSLLNPGYSQVSQYVSELGAAGAQRPDIFATGIMAAGACAIIGGLAFILGLRRKARGLILPLLTGLSIVAWGVSMVLGGLHPMPDERHGAYGLGMAIQAAPLLMFLAISGRADMTGLKTFLLMVFLASGALLAAMMGVGHVVHVAQVGLWQRAYALASIPWIAVAALCLDQALAAKDKKDRAAKA